MFSIKQISIDEIINNEDIKINFPNSIKFLSSEYSSNDNMLIFFIYGDSSVNDLPFSLFCAFNKSKYSYERELNIPFLEISTSFSNLNLETYVIKSIIAAATEDGFNYLTVPVPSVTHKSFFEQFGFYEYLLDGVPTFILKLT